MFELLGLAAGVLSGISYIPYIKDVFHRTTKPERASWFIWTVLGSIAFFSQLAEGATWSLWLTGIDTLGVLFIFLLSIQYGVGGLSRRDIIALTAAGIGLLLWYFTKEAVIALIVIIIIDLLGASLTIVKAYEDPKSETLSTWLMVAIAGALGMIAVGKMDFVLLAYPCYIFIADSSVVVAILFGKNKHKKLK